MGRPETLTQHDSNDPVSPQRPESAPVRETSETSEHRVLGVLTTHATRQALPVMRALSQKQFSAQASRVGWRIQTGQRQTMELCPKLAPGAVAARSGGWRMLAWWPPLLGPARGATRREQRALVVQFWASARGMSHQPSCGRVPSPRHPPRTRNKPTL